MALALEMLLQVSTGQTFLPSYDIQHVIATVVHPCVSVNNLTWEWWWGRLQYTSGRDSVLTSVSISTRALTYTLNLTLQSTFGIITFIPEMAHTHLTRSHLRSDYITFHDPSNVSLLCKPCGPCEHPLVQIQAGCCFSVFIWTSFDVPLSALSSMFLCPLLTGRLSPPVCPCVSVIHIFIWRRWSMINVIMFSPLT